MCLCDRQASVVIVRPSTISKKNISETSEPILDKFEPSRGKTINVFSEQVRHKPACTSTEEGRKLEMLDLERR